GCLFLVVVTICAVLLIEQYVQSGPGMLKEGNWQIQKPEKRVARVDGDGLFLSSSDASKSVNIGQAVQSQGHSFVVQLSTDIRSLDVVPGVKPWDRARLVLLQYEGKTARYDVSHVAATLEGTHEWEHYRKAFEIQPWASEFRVTVQLGRCTGSLEIKNIRLYPVVVSKVYTLAQRSVLGAWGIFFVFLLGSFLVKGRYGVQGVLIVCFAGILFGAMIPGDLKTEIYGRVIVQIQLLHGMAGPEGEMIIGKIGHFCLFGILGLVLGVLMPGKSPAYIGANILMLAGGTELVQFFIDGRTPLFVDFLIDLSGGVAGLALVQVFMMGRRLAQVNAD
ncbi:MAG: VanZ family protein, partial [Desulfobacula sp.]|nr:VanZ family protein [Desulfobacula sp.]